jgi:hypothetical protein
VARDGSSGWWRFDGCPRGSPPPDSDPIAGTRAMWKLATVLSLSAVLESCASSSALRRATECHPSPLTLELASASPAAGTGPVWMVDGNFGCWRDGRPAKALWIVDRQFPGPLEVRGELVSGGALVTFQRQEDRDPVSRLIIPNASETGVVPGDASPSELAEYSFHPSSVLYPQPGCWRLSASLGGIEVTIVVQQALCDASDRPASKPAPDRHPPVLPRSPAKRLAALDAPPAPRRTRPVRR